MYPTDFPITEATEVVSIVRNSRVAEQKERFAYDLWIIQGYAQSKIVGEPEAQTVLIDYSDEEAVEALASQLSVAPQLAINWKAVANWAAKMLIGLWLEQQSYG